MQNFLTELSERRRFGMKPGLDTIRDLCARVGNPQDTLRAIHVAGTNGKGAVCAILDACLRVANFRVARYTSPHLVCLNERFFFDGVPLDDASLASAAARIEKISRENSVFAELTFFEALTAVAFLVFFAKNPDFAIFETGLGGRLDATNICSPQVSVITRIGLDHCDWLGDTREKIAREKAGIIKPNTPIVLGENEADVIAVVRARARELNAPFFYAPDFASRDDDEIFAKGALAGSFNRENAQTARAVLQILAMQTRENEILANREILANGFAKTIWPGRFQCVGRFLIDGAHNPPAARALASALEANEKFILIAGFCGDKDVDETLRILAPHISRAIAVKTNNPRSLDAKILAMKMNAVGIAADFRENLSDALDACATDDSSSRILICGSLFLAGEALVALQAYPWALTRNDPAELLRVSEK